MILGIVGSSYSTGDHSMPDGSTTGHFDDQLKACFGNTIPVHNAAQGGHGSEKYLNTILYLWNKYKITHCIIEYIEDRSLKSNRYKTNNWYTKNLHKIDIAWERNIAKDTHTLMYENKFQKRINDAYDDTPRLEWWTRHNMLQAVQLCNALDIEIIMWKMHNYVDLNNKNYNELQGETINLLQKQWKDKDHWVMFGKHQWARDYFVEKYGLENHVCADGVHLSTDCQKENVKILAESVAKTWM